MKALYTLRVIVISGEMAILLLCWIALTQFNTQASTLAKSLDINEEIVKFLILLPIALFAWIIKESKELIFSEKDHTKQLVNWPDYWRLKIHIYVSFLFSVIFCITSIIPWLSKTGISNGIGLILFTAGVVGCLWVAGSIYFAQMSVKEIFNTEYDQNNEKSAATD